MRHDLATREFRAENEFQVREPSHSLGANYIEFLEHARAVVRRLVYHAPDQDHLGINRHARCWEPERIKFVCVDLDTNEFSVLAADVADAREILFARENGNHFLPLQVSHTHKTDLLPWDTDVVAERLRRRQEGARRREAADATADERDDEVSSSDRGEAASAEDQGEHTEGESEQSSADVCVSSSHSTSSSERGADEADASGGWVSMTVTRICQTRHMTPRLPR